MSILADTSGLIALLDRDSTMHEAVRPYFDQLLVPTTVLTEFDYLATRRIGPQVVRDFYRGVSRGEVAYLPVEAGDLKRAFEVLDQYHDARIGLVDASIVALAERYRLKRVLTLDRRHFAKFRPKGLEYLELLP